MSPPLTLLCFDSCREKKALTGLLVHYLAFSLRWACLWCGCWSRLHGTDSWIIHEKTSASVYTADMSGDINVSWSDIGVPFVSPISPFSTCHLCALNTDIRCRPPRLVYFKPFLHNLSSKAEFLQRREECGIKDGMLVIKAIEFSVDLRRDLNAPCLHSLWGGAGNINDSSFYLIPCQKQSLWGVGPGGHLAQSCFTHHHFFFFFTFFKHTHFQLFWLGCNLHLATDNLSVSKCCFSSCFFENLLFYSFWLWFVLIWCTFGRQRVVVMTCFYPMRCLKKSV